MVEITTTKEKILVLVGTIGASVSGYLLASGYVAEATLLASITASIVAFWSEGVNTK